MDKHLLIILGLGLCLLPSRLLAVEVAPRISDKELIEWLTRLEEGLKGLAQRIDDTNRRIDDTNRRIDDLNQTLSQRIDDLNRHIDETNRRIEELQEYLLWGFGVLFAGMFTLVGFVLWDRRSALAPAVRRTEELQERERRLEAALREYAATTPELAASLKKEGLL